MFFFTFAKISRSLRVEFGAVLFQLNFHSRTFTLQLRLLSNSQLSRHFDWKRCANNKKRQN